MEQELISTSDKTVAIIGAGPAGCMCAKILTDANIDVSLFDKGKFLRTILPTGGGRCNLAHAIYDFKELAKNYPRGEKFLYSAFSKFGTSETIDFFNSIGIKTYTQDNNRIFPVSNSSSQVRDKILNAINNCHFIKENVTIIKPLKSGYEVITEKSNYYFDKVIVATGGHSKYDLLKNFDIKIIPPTPSLAGLTTEENFTNIAGVSIKNVSTCINKNQIDGDIIFTHKGISGPLIYTISSVYARKELPYIITLKLTNEFDFQKLLNENPHKEIKNLISNFVPKSFAQFLLENLGINKETKAYNINGKMRDAIYNKLISYPIKITGKVPDSEVVTCGGINLDEVNSKTMEAKKYMGLYFCGEILDIDGFCGGFNLQNCWSTGFVAAKSVLESI